MTDRDRDFSDDDDTVFSEGGDPDFSEPLTDQYGRDSAEYRAHLSRMNGLPYAEALAVIERALERTKTTGSLGDYDAMVDSDDVLLWINLVRDVRWRPNYWIDLRNKATDRRDHRERNVLDAAERHFGRLGGLKKGRPGARRGEREPLDEDRRAIILAETRRVQLELRPIFAIRRDDMQTFRERLELYCHEYAHLSEPEAARRVADFLRKNNTRPATFANLLVGIKLKLGEKKVKNIPRRLLP